MPKTSSIRITNTIEFFPHNCTLPVLDPIDTVAHILSDLQTALTTFPKNNLLSGPNQSLLQALNDIQGLLGLDEHHDTKVPVRITQQEECNTSKGGSRRITRSQTKKIHQNGTIIKKKFNKTWYKGEVTKYDPQADFYTIKYTDGDTEEMTYMEVKQYKKPLQQYSPHNRTLHQQQPTVRAYISRVLRAGCIWDES